MEKRRGPATRPGWQIALSIEHLVHFQRCRHLDTLIVRPEAVTEVDPRWGLVEYGGLEYGARSTGV